MDLSTTSSGLVTPARTDDGRARTWKGTIRPSGAATPHYQLTHDYLIPDLREWLFRDRQKTLRGRAELQLQEFASVWSERQQGQVPALGVGMGGARVVDRPEAMVVRPADHDAGRRRPACPRATAAAALAAVVGLLGLLDVRGGPGPIAGRGPQERRDRPGPADLCARSTRSASGPCPAPPRSGAGATRRPARLRCSLALLPDDPGQVDYLVGRMLAEDPVTALAIREALFPSRGAITAGLWAVAKDSRRPAADRLRRRPGPLPVRPADGWAASRGVG